MRNFRNKLISFMYGRNGMDKYNNFLFILYFIILILQWILSIFIPAGLSLAFSLILLSLIAYITFRCMSKNIYKRQAENRRFLAISDRIKAYFRLQKNKFHDRKTHVYRKCPSCKAVLRLKKIRGKHRAVCPRCSKSFNVLV